MNRMADGGTFQTKGPRTRKELNAHTAIFDKDWAGNGVIIPHSTSAFPHEMARVFLAPFAVRCSAGKRTVHPSNLVSAITAESLHSEIWISGI